MADDEVIPGYTKRRHSIRKWRAFLDAFVILGTISSACRKSGFSRKSFYNYMEEEVHRKRFAQAEKDHAEFLIREATRRAADGTKELVLEKGVPVFVWVDADGEVVEDERYAVKRVPIYKNKYSDSLLVFMLKNRCGFKDQTELKVGGDGSSIGLNHQGNVGLDVFAHIDSVSAAIAAATGHEILEGVSGGDGGDESLHPTPEEARRVFGPKMPPQTS